MLVRITDIDDNHAVRPEGKELIPIELIPIGMSVSSRCNSPCRALIVPL